MSEFDIAIIVLMVATPALTGVIIFTPRREKQHKNTKKRVGGGRRAKVKTRSRGYVGKHEHHHVK